LVDFEILINEMQVSVCGEPVAGLLRSPAVRIKIKNQCNYVKTDP